MRIVWIFMIFCAFIAAASAITCYDCNSLSDPRCNLPLYIHKVKQTNCDEAEMPEYLQKFEEFQIRRIDAKGCITKTYNGVTNDTSSTYVRRGCFFGFVDDTKEACKMNDSYVPWGRLLDCHVCTDDLCNTNSGRKKASSKIVLSASILLTLVANKI